MEARRTARHALGSHLLSEEYYWNGDGETAFQVQFARGDFVTPALLSRISWTNWFAKHRYAESAALLKDLPARYGADSRFQQRWPQFRQQILAMENEDRIYWGGWYARHGGQITYIGDHFRSKFIDDIMIALELVLLAGLLIAVMQQMNKAPETASPFARTQLE